MNISHFYGDKEAVYDIYGNLIEGNLDKGGRKLTEAWIKPRTEQLKEMWNQAVIGIPDSIKKFK